jgi:hypothetical protein
MSLKFLDNCAEPDYNDNMEQVTPKQQKSQEPQAQVRDTLRKRETIPASTAMCGYKTENPHIAQLVRGKFP